MQLQLQDGLWHKIQEQSLSLVVVQDVTTLEELVNGLSLDLELDTVNDDSGSFPQRCREPDGNDE